MFKESGGKVIKINSALVYENFDFVFDGFVSEFTKIREKGGYYKIFGKLMINSLYGSMALNQKDYIATIVFSEDEFYNIYKNTDVGYFYKINTSFYISIVNNYKAQHFFNQKSKNTSTRNVSYAAAIASKARIKLYLAMRGVLNDGGRLLYCDTDSIFAAYNKNDFRGTFDALT